MNFIDYCIKTKNYSAIKAVNSYTKTFARTNTEFTDQKDRNYLTNKFNRNRSVYDDDPELRDIMNNVDREEVMERQKK